jgi:peptidoglycan/xylan/chitin deacetylase (PgdA/CDA1 family)
MQGDPRDTEREPLFSISPYKYPYRGAVALSFDFETSATYGDFANLGTKLRSALIALSARLAKKQRDLSFHYGMGYAMRAGARNIIEVLMEFGIHATWFATGHVLLKGNRERNAYRINQRLPYAAPAAGFTDITTWRKDEPTFQNEPFGDHKSHPCWYFGDLSRTLLDLGEDIQCHTFSHPYVALEPVENIRMDIEDWQAAAAANGFPRASIFSFPFGGDVFRRYQGLHLDAMIGKRIPGATYSIVPLSSAAADVLRENGIELLTRCGSKYGACGVFEPYNDSGLFFMPDQEFIPGKDDTGSLDGTTNRVASLGAAVNLWMHPSEVFTEEQKQKFHDMVSRLTAAAESGRIWINTIAGIWDFYKKVQKCAMTIDRPAGEYIEVRVTNNGRARIENILLAANVPVPALAGQNNNIEPCSSGFLIKALGDRETIRFRFRKTIRP